MTWLYCLYAREMRNISTDIKVLTNRCHNQQTIDTNDYGLMLGCNHRKELLRR